MTGDEVYLKGITYKIMKGFNKSKQLTSQQTKWLRDQTISSPAAGLIYYQNNRIQPVIYVRATDSLVWESACGSGSLAFALLSKNQVVLQPSGQTLRFNFSQKEVTITATVKEINL